jgi:hypothetical protein
VAGSEPTSPLRGIVQRIVERILQRILQHIIERIAQHIVIEKYNRPGEGSLRLLEGYIIALMIHFCRVIDIFEPLLYDILIQFLIIIYTRKASLCRGSHFWARKSMPIDRALTAHRRISRLPAPGDFE